jgi:hypothetical protein
MWSTDYWTEPFELEQVGEDELQIYFKGT